MRLGGAQNAERVWEGVTTCACGSVLTLCPLLCLPYPPICLLCLCSPPTTVCPPLLPLLVVSIDLLPSRCLLLSVSPCLFGPVPVSSLHLWRFPHFCFLMSRCSGTRGLSSPIRPRGGAASLSPPRPRSPAACKRKEQEQQKERALQPKKQRLVFTDLQRRTLIAIFKENKLST